jgi:hypothetical protein
MMARSASQRNSATYKNMGLEIISFFFCVLPRDSFGDI